MDDELVEDELAESNRERVPSGLKSFGEAALTVGVGAAFLYRGRGGKHLARDISKASKFLRGAASEISSHSLSDFDAQGIKQAGQRLKNIWDEADKATDIGVRLDDSHSIWGATTEALRMMKNPDNYLGQLFDRDNIIMPTADHFRDLYAPEDDILGTKIDRFTQQAMSLLHDDEKLRTLAEEQFGKDSDFGYQEIVDHMNKMIEDNHTARDKFIKEQQGVAEKAFEEAINPENLKRNLGSFGEQSDLRFAADSVLGDRAATVDDLIRVAESKQSFFYKEDGDLKSSNPIEHLKELKAILAEKNAKSAEDFGKLYVDRNVIRVNEQGEVYSFKDAADFKDKLVREFADTLPGKILKARDYEQIRKAPSMYFFGKGDADPILAALSNKSTTRNKYTIDDNYIRIHDRTYRVVDKGLEHVKELDDTYLMSGRYGTMPRVLKSLVGDVDYRRSDNRFMRYFDINQAGEASWIKKFWSKHTKYHDPNWRGNVMDYFLNPDANQQVEFDFFKRAYESGEHPEEARQFAMDYIHKAREFNNFLAKNTYDLDKHTIEKLKPHIDSQARHLLDALSMGDEEMLNHILHGRTSSITHINNFANQDLVSLLHKYVANPEAAKASISLKSDKSGFVGGGRETADFYHILRSEIAKEAFLQHAAGAGGYDSLVHLMEQAGLKGRAKTEAKRLAHWAAFQKLTNVTARASRDKNGADALWRQVEDIEQMFIRPEGPGKDTLFRHDFQRTMKNMQKEKIKISESHRVEDDNLMRANRYGRYIHMRKGIGIIEAINSKEKFKAFYKQWNAGYKDPHNITDYTMAPYFFMSRLSDAMNEVGLGFSRNSMLSSGQLAKNIMLKRVLPIAIGLGYADYGDDLVRALTGTSALGYLGNGVANADLAMRKAFDVTGMSDAIRNEKDINPIMQYWMGKDQWQSYDERKKWYESGYEPVRKGRFWSFGSVNEFRGGKIDYFQANWLRRIHADSKDKSLYDGFFDKWSHSWLPTPTNPLSPLAKILDPYWLEKKHYNDRPYMLTGRMFDPATPWGIVLNPTVGQLLKPVKMMHQDRLQGTLVDVKRIIYERNKQVYQNAIDKDQNLLRFKNGEVEPVKFTNYNAPTMDERVVSTQILNGKVSATQEGAYGIYEGGLSPSEYLRANEAAGNSVQGIQGLAADVGFGNQQEVLPIELQNKGKYARGLSTRDKIEIGAKEGGLVSGLAKEFLTKVEPLQNIEGVNRQIIAQAAAKGEYDPSQGVITPEALHRVPFKNSTYMLDDVEARADMMNLNSGAQLVKETAESWRMISGIYGWMGSEVIPGMRPSQRRLADASDMTSGARSFWDTSIGGVGGESMEIIRRFLPEWRRSDHINPLMNEMPDWLPEKYRFGDPFTLLPNGEERLPGKGYEALYKLHPDQFGRYGALDRFRVLADVAPHSPEYKVWRAIAQKTIINPEDKEEFKEIRHRVAEASKAHDFYDYKFLGKGLSYRKVTVGKVIDNNHFTIYGDDKTQYRLAGVRVKADKDGKPVLANYVHAGQDITIAVDADPSYQHDKDKAHSINAAVFIDGENLGQQLIEEGHAVVRKGDISAAATVAKYSTFERLRGSLYELIAHADVPYFSDKFLRVRTPLESYKSEQVYGTPYQSWSHPIDSYLKPAMERAISSPYEMAIGTAAFAAHHIIRRMENVPTWAKYFADGAYMLSNRGAFIGGFIGGITKMRMGKFANRLADIGAVASMVGWVNTRKDDPIASTINFGIIGTLLERQLTRKITGKWGLIGAAAGFLQAGSKTKIWNLGEATGPWIPERTRKKWEMQEYFDRLNYIKYQGLFEQASRKALAEEGVNVKALIEQHETELKEKAKIKADLEAAKEKIERLYPEGDKTRKRLEVEINKKLQDIQESQLIVKAGKYTRAAFVYKMTADSTMFGLKKDATWTTIVRAINKNDRDYFLEFMKERNPDKRKEILSYVNPYMRKALMQAWGGEAGDQESNESFFRKHKLPGISWAGWKPNVDLQNIEVKEIKNEGMMLADFGFYDSQARTPDVINAPNLGGIHKKQGFLNTEAGLMGVLKGMGLMNVEVSIEPSDKNETEIKADIKRIKEYNLHNHVNQMFSSM